MKESTVVGNIIDMLEIEFPGWWVKIHGSPFQRSGIPDIIGVHKGRFIAIEVKVPGKEANLSQTQKRVIRRMLYAGAIAFMSTSAKHSRLKLEEALNNGEKSKNIKSKRSNGIKKSKSTK